jgi:hypothetical protein
VTNPLRAWLEHNRIPQKEFLEEIQVSRAYLTLLLSSHPPWPSRPIMRRIVKATRGKVTADIWLGLKDPPPQRVTRAS